MGNAIWIEVQGRPGAETHEDLRALHRLSERLDGMAATLRVTAPSAFFDYSPLFPPEEREPASWFDSKQGLETVAALRRRLEGDDAWPAALMEELAWCERVLVEAVRDDRPFRLMIVA